MTQILTIAGILAALILFRWARTIALFVFGALLIWGYVCFAHAQKSPMVQCVTGTVSQVVPDYACDALADGFRELRFDTNSDSARTSTMRCAEAVSRHLVGGPMQFLAICSRMQVSEMVHRTQMR